ncbi:hypothetical protein MKW98_013167, partial [Papaver atlanticum]
HVERIESTEIRCWILSFMPIDGKRYHPSLLRWRNSGSGWKSGSKMATKLHYQCSHL